MQKWRGNERNTLCSPLPKAFHCHNLGSVCRSWTFLIWMLLTSDLNLVRLPLLLACTYLQHAYANINWNHLPKDTTRPQKGLSISTDFTGGFVTTWRKVPSAHAAKLSPTHTFKLLILSASAAFRQLFLFWETNFHYLAFSNLLPHPSPCSGKTCSSQDPFSLTVEVKIINSEKFYSCLSHTFFFTKMGLYCLVTHFVFFKSMCYGRNPEVLFVIILLDWCERQSRCQPVHWEISGRILLQSYPLSHKSHPDYS